MIRRWSVLFFLGMLSLSCSTSEAPVDKNDNQTETPEGPDLGEPFIDENDYTPVTAEQITYYNKIDLTLRGNELKQALSDVLEKTHRQLTYTPDVWNASKITDEDPDNPDNVILLYSWPKGTSKEAIHVRSLHKESRNTSGSKDSNIRVKLWEREHVYAKSLAKPKLVTYGNEPGYTAEGLTAGVDAHNLRPINGEWNYTRSNLKFVEGKGNAGRVSGGWYPGDEWKGDVARMMMYMHIRYGQQCDASRIGVGSRVFYDNGKYDGMIHLFLKWNEEDPVSDIERKRNEYHGNAKNAYAQGNRNPFIDNPYLANLIWENQRGKLKLAENKWAKK